MNKPSRKWLKKMVDIEDDICDVCGEAFRDGAGLRRCSSCGYLQCEACFQDDGCANCEEVGV
jgi:hypothetical protein